MQLIKLSLITLLASYVTADDIDQDDIPIQCRAVCEPALQLSDTCDRQFNNNDQGFSNCFCTATNAEIILSACEACVSNFDDDRSDNDVNALLRSCSFTATAFDDGASTGTPTVTPSIVPAATTNANGAVVTSSGNAAPGLKMETGLMGALFLGALGVVGLA